MFLNIRMKPMD